MNVFTIIILTTLTAEYILNLVADILNLRRLKGEIPPEIGNLTTPEDYNHANDYTRTLTGFGIVSDTVQLAALLLFWFARGFPWLDGIIQANSWHPVITGCIYIGALLALKGVLALPFSVFRTFVIEERFGFNRTTAGTFIMDRLKGFVLVVLIGGPILAGILTFYGYAGNYAWVYSWFAVSAVTVVMQYAAPRWIMPIFNKFTPLEEGELHRNILDYATSQGFSIEGVYVIDGSKRSGKSNAFFTGFGKHKRIALFDTLIEGHTVPELVAVLAHEIGHYRKKHVIEGMVVSIAHSGIIFFLLSLVIGSEGLFEAFFMDRISVYAGLVFFGFLYSPVELLLGIILQSRLRKNEFAADRFAAETTGEPEALADALRKLSVHNLSNLRPHPMYVALHYSHPPVLERIEALRRHML